jgi:hypothetical protein
MRKLIVGTIMAVTLAFAGSAAAALVPGVFEGPPDGFGCPTATYSHGWLHLAKNCASTANAAAGADITGLEGQTFASASFTLLSASQCQGGSPRFDISTTGGLWFAGCNTVTPVINSDGTATYTFGPADLVRQTPTTTLGTITAVDVLIDQQGTADLTKITVNGVRQVPQPTTGDQTKKCKNGGWKTMTNPSFKNQGQCVSHFRHQLNEARHEDVGKRHGH